MMAQAFLERFYELVDDCLADPATSRRLTKAKKLRDFEAAEKSIWERMLRTTGEESTMARAEATVTLQNGERFYRLPGNFRQFLGFEWRINANPNYLQGRLNSVAYSAAGQSGIEILSAQRGMLIHPVPELSGDQDWTLIYVKGPVKLHYATALSLGEKTLQFGTPGAGSGEVVTLDDYYNGSLLHVFSADAGAGQTNEIIDYNGTEQRCHLQHAWSPMPSGTVQYEIRPALPPDYDEVYALAVAMRNCSRRNLRSRKRELQHDFREQLSSCKAYLLSNVADRAPARGLQPVETTDPYTVGY